MDNLVLAIVEAERIPSAVNTFVIAIELLCGIAIEQAKTLVLVLHGV